MLPREHVRTRPSPGTGMCSYPSSMCMLTWAWPPWPPWLRAALLPFSVELLSPASHLRRRRVDVLRTTNAALGQPPKDTARSREQYCLTEESHFHRFRIADDFSLTGCDSQPVSHSAVTQTNMEVVSPAMSVYLSIAKERETLSLSRSFIHASTHAVSQVLANPGFPCTSHFSQGLSVRWIR